jgi:hypothetical protein
MGKVINAEVRAFNKIRRPEVSATFLKKPAIPNSHSSEGLGLIQKEFGFSDI